MFFCPRSKTCWFPMMPFQWICCSQCNLTVSAGFITIFLHLLEGSAQGHVGRSVLIRLISENVFFCVYWRICCNNYVVLSILFSYSAEIDYLILCHRIFTLYNNTYLTNRLVSRLSAGVGSLCQTCHSQHAHDLSIVVDIWNWRTPGWCDKWGWAGSSVHSLPAVHHGLHGNSLLRWPLASATYSSYSGVTPLI